MKLKYLPEIIGQDIDIEKLRPKNSYDYLIENRNSEFISLLNSPKLNEFLISRQCPACLGDEFHEVLKKDNLAIVKCDVCEMIYVNPIFNQRKYEKLYKGNVYSEIIRRHNITSHEYRKKRFGKERMDFIEHYHAPHLPKTLLDIGCNTGFLIEEATNRGWNALGIELNPSAVEFAQSRRLNVINTSIEDMNPEEKLSDICLFDVLEHLVDPRSVMKKIRKILVEGGNIYIYVPNWNSASRILIGEENSHFLWPTHHLTYFTPLTLKTFLERFGFEIFHWETQGLDLVDFRWYLSKKTKDSVHWIDKYQAHLQFYINASGHGKNLRMFAKKKVP